MSFSPVPDHKFKRLEDISPKFLKERGISLLLMDLDNTVSPYKINTPTPEILDWAGKMKKAGITLFIVSNNRGDRPEIFSRALDVQFINRAGKPGCSGVMRAISAAGIEKRETALVGDQVYTDILAANRAGITGILVEPIKFTNPFLAIRYFFELPFRHEKKA